MAVLWITKIFQFLNRPSFARTLLIPSSTSCETFSASDNWSSWLLMGYIDDVKDASYENKGSCLGNTSFRKSAYVISCCFAEFSWQRRHLYFVVYKNCIIIETPLSAGSLKPFTAWRKSKCEWFKSSFNNSIKQRVLWQIFLLTM